MNNSLPFDDSRCNGFGCKQKENCLRFLNLNNIGPRTPVCTLMFDVDSNGNSCQYIIRKEG